MLRETRTRDNFGEEGFLERRLERFSSWERKHFPTPPAPVCELETVAKGGVANHTDDSNVDVFR